VPARLVASDAITASPRAGNVIAFESAYVAGGKGRRYAVTLTKSPQSTERCAELTSGEEKKVTIALQNIAAGAETKLQDDRIIPKSRGCPLDYSITDVVLYDRPGGCRSPSSSSMGSATASRAAAAGSWRFPVFLAEQPQVDQQRESR
jgi:hypothetical protein